MTESDIAADGGRSSEGLPTANGAKAASKVAVLPPGRSARPVFKSAFASMNCDNEKSSKGVVEAMEAKVQGAAATGTNAASSGKHTAGDKGKPRTQTSVFADYPEDGEGNKEGGACESPSKTPIDLGRECSMMHRLMESDKSDVDPRDVHKLLPGQLLSSKSLDLNVDLLQRAIAIAAEREVQRERASKDDGGSSVTRVDEQEVDEQEADEECPEDGDLEEEPVSPASAPSYEVGQLVQNSPRPPSPPKTRIRSYRPPRVNREATSPVPHPLSVSPIPGWPTPPPMVHHVSPALGMAPMGARAPTPPSPYMDQRMSPIPMPVSAPYGMMSPVNPAVSVGPVPMPWGGYPPLQQMPNYALPGHLPVPTHPVPMEAMPLPGLPPKPVQGPMGGMHVPMMAHSPPPMHLPRARSAVPGEMRTVTPPGIRARSATPEYDGSNSPPPGGKDLNGRARRFRSVEAALAWCHVQHSQKQVPVVPKEDVKRLVEFQLNSRKPIRAPWYRPQKDSEEVDENAGDEAAVPANKDAEQGTAAQVAPDLGKPPKPVAAAASEPTKEKEGVQDAAPMVASKRPRSLIPVRKPLTPTVRMSPSPPARMNPMAPMQLSPKTPESNERDSRATAPAPVRLPVTKKVTPQPVWKHPQAPTPQRVSNSPAAKQVAPRAGAGATISRSRATGMRRHGTGFFVPAGLPA